MAESLAEWVADDVDPYRDKSIAWLSQYHFFRDPFRPTFSDTSYFFSPADGIIIYQSEVEPDEAIVDIKGRRYSVRDVLRDPGYDQPSLVVGIFMTFFDVHVNRVPFPGRLCYRPSDPIDTLNYPMLDIEQGLLDELRISLGTASYLHNNQRMVNRIDSMQLPGSYYVVQIADYDVDSITPFELRQHQPVQQGQRFSMIRYGSQVELVIPLAEHYQLVPLQAIGDHVEAGIDALVEIRRPQPTPTPSGGRR